MASHQAIPPPPGVYVPVPTFFSSSSKDAAAVSKLYKNRIANEVQAAHAIHLATSGIKGLVLLGSTGESIHLQPAERTTLISSVRKALDDADFRKYPIMVGVLTNSIEDAIEQLQSAKEAGGDYGLVLAPGYFGAGVSQEGIVEWYKTIADASPMPILLYHYPGVTNNVSLTIPTYVALSAHPNIVGAKMSHGNVSHHMQVSLHPSIDHSQFHLYSGFGQQLYPIVSMGGAGVIDGMAAFFPKTVVRLYNLSISLPADEAQMKEIGRLQFAVSSMEEWVRSYGIAGIKVAIAKVLGMGELENRAPIVNNVGDGEWAKWKEQVQRMKEIEDSLGEERK